VLEDVRDEAKKHDVSERSGKAINSAKESGKEGLRAWNGKRKSGKKS